jgi:hypothetical protein
MTLAENAKRLNEGKSPGYKTVKEKRLLEFDPNISQSAINLSNQTMYQSNVQENISVVPEK